MTNQTRIIVKVEPLGAGAFTHDLQCWHCQENPAVYRGNPYWDFVPCWACQETYIGVWTKKTFWEKLSDLLLN